MITLSPIRRALVPVNADAAQRLCAENYDEFQSDQDITNLFVNRPDCVLKVTMPHCNVKENGEVQEGSAQALEIAKREMASLKAGDLTREVEDALLVYEITDTERPGVRQIGLVGMAQNQQIRTEATPDGSIIRNEGIRQKKADGRADLIRATDAIIGMVMNTIDDTSGKVTEALEAYADSRTCDYQAEIESGNVQKLWLIEEPEARTNFLSLMEAEPYAYVADGNHRSAAAAMFGRGEFLSVFFPARTMGLAPYNRLIKIDKIPLPELEAALEKNFKVDKRTDIEVFEPTQVNDIGLYTQGTWFQLTPLPGSFDPSNAVQVIDSDIVQRHIFNAIFDISDPADERLKFVGGNHDVQYIKSKVDDGSYNFAISLAPVTIEQFIDVCQQNRIMPPKSTWFQPKIRSGLVIALLE